MNFMKRLLITFFSLVAYFLVNFTTVSAATNNIEDSTIADNIQENINNLDDNKEVKSKKSEEDLFGDEQTFPFVAGLGKNAAH